MKNRNKDKYKSWKIVLSIGVTILILVMMVAIYLGDYYRADMERIENFTYGKEVEVKYDENGNMIFIPDEIKNGFIFYPGGKVEYTSYIPLMQALAMEGNLGILVEMPFNLAVLDVDAAEGYREKYQEVQDWYIGGHSLGGSMAANYLLENADSFEGLVLLGSYSVDDLSELDMEVLSVYGSEDMVLNREKYEENKSNLPSDFTEIVIEGGCHAYFGMYGAQEGDGIPKITNEEQIFKTVQAINILRE